MDETMSDMDDLLSLSACLKTSMSARLSVVESSP
jgi:hypothetical protein